jgi:hypothetical protein
VKLQAHLEDQRPELFMEEDNAKDV